MSPATENYALNASRKNFVMAHEEPLPFTYVSHKGQDITYKTPDGGEAHAYVIPSAIPTNYYLFVIHEWWGLNDYVKQQSEKLGMQLGVNVIALDLYDKQLATTREEAAKYMQAVSTERAMSIIHGAYAYAGEKAKVFTIGWCFGGGWSLQTAIEGGKQTAGCVMFYGQPEKEIERLTKIDFDVIGFFGNKDKWPSPEVVNQFVKDAEKAGVDLKVYRYDADHGFSNPSNPSFDKVATEDAYNKVHDFIKARMN